MKKVYTLSNVQSCPCLPEDKKSPFSVYPGEDLFETRQSSSLCGGTITDDIDKLILYLLNRFLFSTSALLQIAMQNLGIAIDQKQIQKRLKLLNEREFVSSYRFASSEAYSSGKTYSLAWRGHGFLRSQQISSNLRQYTQALIEAREVAQIKRILSAQQFALRNGYDIEDIEVCKTVFVPAKEGNTTTKIFRSQAVICDHDSHIFVESVRRTPEWEQELISKLNRMGETFQLAKSLNVSIDTNKTILLLIGEDANHMREIMTLTKTSLWGFPIAVQYTADTMVYSNHEYVYALKLPWFAKLFSA